MPQNQTPERWLLIHSTEFKTLQKILSQPSDHFPTIKNAGDWISFSDMTN